jgi:hypothetical protein
MLFLQEEIEANQLIFQKIAYFLGVYRVSQITIFTL